MDDSKQEGNNQRVAPYFMIRLCGPFRAERRVGTGYESVRIPEWGGSSYPRLLLKALLCSPGRQARREVLLEMLWPECDLEQSTQYLNTATTKLRQVLRPAKGQESFLITEEDATLYRLEGQSFLWTDVDAALVLLNRVEHFGRTSLRGLPLLEQAAKYLGRGVLLEEEGDAWVSSRRATIDRARYRCRLWLSEAYTFHDRLGPAEAVLSLLLEEDPTDEDVVCRLMELFHRQGMTHQAFRLYSQTCDLLAVDGLEPTEVTKGLAEGFRTEKQRPIFHPELPVLDWGEAPSSEQFSGREKDLATLTSWVVEDQCRVAALFGMGGIGKTSLAVTLVDTIKDSFEYIFWRSLQHAPLGPSVLQDCIKFLSDQRQTDFPEDSSNQIALLMQFLQQHRCLLVLDNVETILQSGVNTGIYRDGYEDYGRLFRRLGEANHQSCLILTSREKPSDVARLEGKQSAVRSLHLVGIGLQEGKEILNEKGLIGADEDWMRLIQRYSGNPLALKLIAEPIREVFNANVSAFLQEEDILIADVRALLDQQFERLSEHEKDIMYWLAIEREPISLETLWKEVTSFGSKKEVFDGLTSLRRRSMVEMSATAHFTLQPVIMEYVTDTLMMQFCDEMSTGTIRLLSSHALMKAYASEYIRETQVRLILSPLVEQLLANAGRQELEDMIKRMLAQLREEPSQASGYAAGNLLNMLVQMHADVRNYDFSHFSVRQAFLQGVSLSGVNFAHANLKESVFTDTFGSILSVTFSPQGSFLAAGTTKNDIRLWQVPDGIPHLTFCGHNAWVRSVAFHPAGEIMASGSDDQTVRLWDVKTGICLKTLTGHTGWVRSVAFSPDGSMLASCGEDHTIQIWDARNGYNLAVLQGHTGRIRTIAFHSDGSLLASGGEDQSIRLWNIKSGTCISILQGHTNRIRSIAFSPDGRTLASGSDDKTMRLWDVENGTVLNTLSGHLDCIRSVTFSPDGEMLASGSEDRTVRLWDLKADRCLKTLQGHTNWVWSVAFSPDGNMLASGSEDQTVCLWEVKSGSCLKVLQGYVNWGWSVAFSPDESILASGGEDYAVRFWDTSTGHCLKTLTGHTSRVRSVAFSPNGTMLVSSSEDRTIRLWDTSSGRCLDILEGYTYRVWSIAFSPDGKTLVSAGEDQSVCCWSTRDMRRVKMLQGHTDRIRSVAFRSDGQMIASGSEDQTVHLWEVSTGHCLKELRGHEGRVWSVAFSLDGSLVASGGDDQTVRLWDTSTGKCLHVLHDHTSRVRAVTFSPDGELLASGSEDSTIRLWETRTGQLIALLTSHEGRILSITFNASGSVLASSSDDGTIKFWERDTNECWQTLYMHKPYDQMNITDVRGLTLVQKVTLKALGAVEENR